MRNKLAGIFKGKSKSAKYYHENPEARDKKEVYDTKYHSTGARRKYRSVLGALNRKMGTYGNHDGKDLAHQSKDKVIVQAQSKNRGDKKRKFFK